MRAIFLWIYCMDIPDVLSLALLGTLCFLVLRRSCSAKPWWRWLLGGLFLLWIAAVLTMTVATRQSGTPEASLMPFSSYVDAFRNSRRERLRSNFMNVLLFYPAGLIFWELLPRISYRRKLLLTTAGAFLLSTAVECMQYFGMLGLAETDDVIHNTLGAVLAAAVCCIRFRGSHHHDTNGTDLPAYSGDSADP